MKRAYAEAQPRRACRPAVAQGSGVSVAALRVSPSDARCTSSPSRSMMKRDVASARRRPAGWSSVERRSLSSPSSSQRSPPSNGRARTAPAPNRGRQITLSSLGHGVIRDMRLDPNPLPVTGASGSLPSDFNHSWGQSRLNRHDRLSLWVVCRLARGVYRLRTKNTKGSATLRTSAQATNPGCLRLPFAGIGQCKIDAEGKGCRAGFTVASLHVKAAKVIVLMPILQIVQIGKSTSYVESYG
jgi:hypothetical protein